MLEIFKRSKIREWEIRLLRNVLKQLPAEFKNLEEQIDTGLLNGVLMPLDGSSGYVGFAYNQKVFSRIKIENKSSYKITGIRVYDKKSRSQLLYTIYISHGMIHGYSVNGTNNFSLDVDKTDVSWFVQVFQEIHNFNRIRKN
jgi:hypothetical protein